VQQWVLEKGGDTVRFELDGRHYELEIGLQAAA
jgi:hypothetical protein